MSILTQLPPAGYHYWGSVPTFNNNIISKLLRPPRNNISRGEFYKDCYSVITNKSWRCIVGDCYCKNKIVAMAARSSSGKTEFENFYKHLCLHHAFYLSSEDYMSHIGESTSSTPQSTLSTFLVSPAINNSAAESVAEIAVVGKKRAASQVANIRRKLIDAFVKVVAHGAFPYSILANRAVQNLLVELDVVLTWQVCTQ